MMVIHALYSQQIYDDTYIKVSCFMSLHVRGTTGFPSMWSTSTSMGSQVLAAPDPEAPPESGASP